MRGHRLYALFHLVALRGLRRSIGKALYGMAETLLITQGPGAAKIYWREAHDIFTKLGVREASVVELRLHGLDATAS